MQHALTIDVEDYFQVAAFFDVVDYERWDEYPRRVVQNTRRILELLDRRSVRATFFVLGWVAEREPELVREIAAGGHEIACHGWSHQFIYRQTPECFREETRRSKALLESLSGGPVEGYRAASYSVTNDSRWALEIIREAGFSYDSSVFPVRHDNYGMPDAPHLPHMARTGAGDLLEFPLTTARFGPLSLPVAGGGYFRLYPYAFTRAMILRHERSRTDPFIFYLHPWEIDPSQPQIEGASKKSRFRHYLNLSRCEARLARLVDEFEFVPLGDVARSLLAGQDQTDALPRHAYDAAYA